MSVDWGYVTQPHSCETCDLPITYNHAPDAGPFDNPPLWLHLNLDAAVRHPVRRTGVALVDCLEGTQNLMTSVAKMEEE